MSTDPIADAVDRLLSTYPYVPAAGNGPKCPHCDTSAAQATFIGRTFADHQEVTSYVCTACDRPFTAIREIEQ